MRYHGCCSLWCNPDDSAFCGCTALKNIIVDENNIFYCSVDGVLFNKQKTELIYFPLGKQKINTLYTVPDGVISISDKAFYNCTNLTSVKIPKNLSSIGESAFTLCEKITSMDLSATNLKSIGNRAFNDCYALAKIVLPTSLENLGYMTFSACSGLTDITINKEKGSLDLTYSGFSEEQKAIVKWGI